MAPLRRYLRISKYSVLECRIYLDNPALADSWLLNARNPILPQVIESVRPLVLPKLREENERSKGKSSKKKAFKDVVVEGKCCRSVAIYLLIIADDFEVSIFLTETSTRHSLLTKHKHFRDPSKKALESNSQKLTGASNETAIEVEDIPVIRREDSEEGELSLQDLPTADEEVEEEDPLFVADGGPRRSKRTRATTMNGSPDSASFAFETTEPGPKRRKEIDLLEDEEQGDDKKKMAMETTYDGFSIYGRVLCLVVKRKDARGKGPAKSGGQAMMEDWIISTQMPPPEADD